MPKEAGKGKEQQDKETPNRRTYSVNARIVTGGPRGKRDVVVVTNCTCCGRAHPNIEILKGVSGGDYYNCPVTSGVVYVRIR